MSQRREVLSRAQLLGGVVATGVLVACGGSSSTPSGSPTFAPSCSVVPPTPPADRFGLNEMFSDPVFAGLDTGTLLDAFDTSPHIEANQQGYLAQTGQQSQHASVITQIPSQGIVIQTPGTYTFGGNIAWSPNNATSSAITIQCSNVTLDLAGYTLNISVADKSRQITGILVSGSVDEIAIINGIVAGATEYGVVAKNVCGLHISRITVTGICMQNLTVRFLTPAGIQVMDSNGVTISNCSVTGLNVTTDSSAGFQLVKTNAATVTDCIVVGMVNNDGAVQGFGYLGCTNVATNRCTAESLQSHFNGNILTTGHTVLGFCPIFCLSLSYDNCTASGLTGCCDDCHGMSVFIDGFVSVNGFQAINVVDGVAPTNTGAKATGLEVYGVGVTITGCTVNGIKAINPQDLQAAGFSAWGLSIAFNGCSASNVTVQDDLGHGSLGVGYGWAPDPRIYFRYIGAYNVTYTDCQADHCDAGFDTWNHVNSTWTNPVYTNCTTGILVQHGATRILTADACAEAVPSISYMATNFESGNTYPGS